MTRYYQPEGTTLTDDQSKRLREMFNRQRTNAENLVERLREERSRQIDFIADTRTMRMVPVSSEHQEILPEIPQSERSQPIKPKVAIVGREDDTDWYAGDEENGVPGTGAIALNAHSHHQVGQRLGIPRKYYVRMLEEQPDLLAHNVNTWFDEKPEPRMVRAMLTNGGGPRMAFARGFMSNSYRRLDALELTDTLVPFLSDESNGWQIEQCGVTDIAVHIEASLPTLQQEIKVGQPVSLGVKIRTSDVGAGALSVAMGPKVLVCSNLMWVPEYTERIVHLGAKQGETVEFLSERTIRMEDRLIMAKMRDLVVSMSNEDRFSEMCLSMRESTTAQLVDPVAATVVLKGNAGLTEGELNRVQGELMADSENGPTVWGLANALTATARQMDFERKTELETAAGKLMTAPRSWKQYTEAAA